MKKHNLWKRVWTCFMLLVMVSSLNTVAFADEGWNDSATPALVLGGDGVYEVEAGKENRISFQVKNRGGAAANNVFVEVRASGADPFRISVQGSNAGTIGANGYKDIIMTVNMENEIPESSYAVTVMYTYLTNGGVAMSGSDTIYLRVKGFNQGDGFAFEGMKLSPEVMSAGNSANLTGRLVNNGSADMYDVEVTLANLKTNEISLVGGFSSKHMTKIAGGGQLDFNFPLVAGGDMAAGNYPVTIVVKYKDARGNAQERTHDYYVNVGGVAGQRAQLEVRNMQEPSGVYGVNQNFTVQFELYNAGQVAAKNIVVTADAVESGMVVPKSGSVKTLISLEPGASTVLSYTFAATSAASSRNYAIQFTTEYTSGGTTVSSFRQYAGVNISNPEKDDDDDKGSKPKVIVSNYECDPLIVMAGGEFDLNLTLLNTHQNKTIKNLKMFLTLAEETSSNDERSGNIFTPVNSSNTFYFDSIAPKSTTEKSLRLYVVPQAQPKTYTLTVNFEYEDMDGNEYTATELLGINVKQITEIQMDEFMLPESIELYSPIMVSFSYYNTGKVTLNNVMIRIEGDVETDTRSTYVGNMESGDSDYFDAMFTPMSTGEVPISIVISYEDSSGEQNEERRDFIVNVMEPMMYDDWAWEDMEQADEGMDMKTVLISGGILALLAVLFAVFVKKQKESPKNSFAESLDDLEDEEDEDEEGMSI